MKKAISAAQTRMYLENLNAPADGTGLVIGASKSEPSVIQLDDVSKLRNGASIFLIGTGWTSLDLKSWVVQNIDYTAKTATLAQSDTSGETDPIGANAAWLLHAYVDVCAKSYQINENAAASIDTTTLCDNAKTSLVGFSDPGTLTFDFFIDPTDPDYQELRAAQKDGKTRMFEVVYQNKAVRTLPVIVQSVNESGGVDQAVQGAGTMKITGPDVLTMPPGQATANYVLIPVLSPTTGQAPLDVTLTLNEAGGVATGFSINWKDGSPAEQVTTKIVPHQYLTAGSYMPSVIATVAGQPTAPFKAQNAVTIEAPPYSLGASVAPLSGAAPLDVTVSLTESNGTADYFDVDWGDDTTVERVSALSATHNYAAAGSYPVTVTPTLAGVPGAAVPAGTVDVA
ncbi:PKD repeat protein [Paraburkholderia sp. UCT70]|uniref:phage tail tube protein n=1 Tax=Paraburkholderia sp. UCT70 TaxID=2991068 RepID=UPI003D22A9EE